jgi:hypothetical protein
MRWDPDRQIGCIEYQCLAFGFLAAGQRIFAAQAPKSTARWVCEKSCFSPRIRRVEKKGAIPRIHISKKVSALPKRHSRTEWGGYNFFFSLRLGGSAGGFGKWRFRA